MPLFAETNGKAVSFRGSQKTCLTHLTQAFGRKAKENMTEKSRNSNQACRKWFSHACSHIVILGIILSIGIYSCQQPKTQQHFTEKAKSSARHFVKTTIKYAKGFDIKYVGDYKIVQILNHSAQKTDTTQFVLIQRGNPAPAGFKKSQIIEIPVKKLIGMSSLQIAMADFAESPDIITGLNSLMYVNSPAVRKNIKAGKVKEVGEEGSINTEVIISVHPDLIMAMGNPSASLSRYQTIENAGIPVLLISEWLESTPLGRAEWVKLMAALLNKEELVDRKFAVIEKEYNRLAELGRKAGDKPLVIIGMPYKGSWFVPDGTSFMARFFKDAGADYSWADIKGTGSMPLSFESIAPIALKADYWVNTGTVNTKAEIAAADERYTYFKPFKNNTIYNFNKRINDLGSNDYWESGVVNPHLVLSDFIKIMHPELLPSYELVYYKKIL